MKKAFLFLLLASGVHFGAKAQSTAAAPQKTELTKEQKMQQKAQKEADLVQSFKDAGITADEEKQIRSVMDQINTLKKEIRSDESIPVEQREARVKEAQEGQKLKFKGILGEDKYKSWSKAKKAIAESRKSAGGEAAE